MKALAFFSCLLAGSAACAAVTSDATFGVLKVASTNTQTVISVPWEAAAGGSVLVKDFVKTTDMTEGDELYLYDNELQTYKMWVLNNAGSWVGTTTVTKKKTNIDATAGDNGESPDTIARGNALIIVRADYNDGTNGGKTPASAIYLYGKYNASPVETHTMQYDDDAPKSTLFAPWNATSDGVYVNAANATTTGDIYLAWNGYVGANDTLALQDAKGNTIILSRHDSKWGIYDPFSKGWVYNFKIRPGMGAWYRAAAGERAGAPVATRSVVE